MSASTPTIHDVQFAKGERFDPTKAVTLIDRLLTDQTKDLSFRITASPNQKVSFQVVDFDTSDNTSSIEIIVRGLYPKAEVDSFPYTPIAFSSNTKQHLIYPLVHYGTATNGQWFLPSITPLESKGTLVAQLTHAVAEAANQGATTNINFIVLDRLPYNESNRRDIERRFLNLPKTSDRLKRDIINIAASFGGMMLHELSEKKSQYEFKPLVSEPSPLTPNEFEQKVVSKIREHGLYKTLIIFEIAAPTEQTSLDIASILNGIFWNDQAVRNDFTPYIFTKEAAKRHHVKQINSQAELNKISLTSFLDVLETTPTLESEYTSHLTTAEIAALFHPPFEGMEESLINFVSGNRPAKAIVENKNGIVIGTSSRHEIHLPDSSRYDHINIVGKNGVGKSTLMLEMIRQDIARGKGVCVIDPDGRLVSDILKTAIPDNRIDKGDVIVLDLAETEYPAPLNPLSIRDEKGRITAGLFADIVKRIYPEFERAERARAFLMGALGALNFVDNPTIADAVRLFEDQEFLEATVNDNLDKLDDGTYRFWATYASLSPSNQKDYPYPVIHRLNSLISVDALHPILCHPKALDWNSAMRDNRIILVSLNPKSDTVGEQEQALLGTIVLSIILSTARNHGDAKPFDFYLYIDEVQRFINTPLDKFFAGVRKFGVHLTVANQFLGQLETGVLEALVGNVGGTFIFEIGDTDAGKLERVTSPTFGREQLTSLGKFHPVVKMRIGNDTYPAFDISTKTPTSPPDPSAAEAKAIEIRRRSIEKWTSATRTKIMGDLANRYPRTRIIFDNGNRSEKGRRSKTTKPETPKDGDKSNDGVDKWADDAKA